MRRRNRDKLHRLRTCNPTQLNTEFDLIKLVSQNRTFCLFRLVKFSGIAYNYNPQKSTVVWSEAVFLVKLNQNGSNFFSLNHLHHLRRSIKHSSSFLPPVLRIQKQVYLNKPITSILSQPRKPAVSLFSRQKYFQNYTGE